MRVKINITLMRERLQSMSDKSENVSTLSRPSSCFCLLCSTSSCFSCCSFSRAADKGESCSLASWLGTKWEEKWQHEKQEWLYEWKEHNVIIFPLSASTWRQNAGCAHCEDTKTEVHIYTEINRKRKVQTDIKQSKISTAFSLTRTAKDE